MNDPITFLNIAVAIPVFRLVRFRLLVCAMVMTTVLAPTLAAALLQPANCQPDVDGANDNPGQRDLTLFCVDDGDGAPYDLLILMNSDEIRLKGANTMDGCALFDLDADGSANLAVCVTLVGSGAVNDNLTAFSMVRLFTCNDANPDRCSGSALVSSPYQTVCEVSQPDTDPFGPAFVDGPGDEYPYDSQILCGVVLDDFGVNVAGARLIDACAFPSTIPNSDPADCILFRGCGSDPDCDDLNGCTVDTCATDGFCRHAAAGPIPCSDGLFCNGDETCNALGFCGGTGATRDCDDGRDCTIDDCDELLDTCVHDPRNTLCDNGAFCDGVETCDSSAGCVSGPPVTCDDTVSCTADACNEATDSCGHEADDTACDDGLFCNGESVCDPLNGCLSGSPPDCADTVSCTVDSCDEIVNSCRHQPNDLACSDDLFCNGTETCGPAGCIPGIAPECDDHVGCTADSCNESADLCLNVPDHGACGDETFCNGTEVCAPLTGCGAGTVPCDAPAICNETIEACADCIEDSDCDNGVYCDGQETCDSGTGTCNDGAPVSCNDGVSCTLDSCDEISGVCRNTASSAICDNGSYCDGQETCDPSTGCLPAATDPCDDAIACTVDTCNELTSTCAHTPDNDACEDGSACNGAETCNAASGCEDGQPASCPADAFNCSVEVCDDDRGGCVSDMSPCVCGDLEITPGEECESPRTAGTFEDCNNGIDDDEDGDEDCMDSECDANTLREPICDEGCHVDHVCEAFRKDPAIIEFGRAGGQDELWIHGRFPLNGTPDPSVEGLDLEISNGIQPIYAASLGAGQMQGNSSRTRFRYRDDDAQALGGESSGGGLSRVSILLREVGGVPYLSFKIRAYGDFSSANHRVMTTQLTIGGEVGSLTEAWTAVPRKWLLRQSAFSSGLSR